MEGLCVDFPRRRLRALHHVDLRISSGEQIALLGPSGSGKTTLLRSLLGGVRPTSGQVRVGGLDPFGPPREVRTIRRFTGVIRQRDDLVLGLSARVNALMSSAPDWGPTDWLAVARGRVPRRYSEELARLAAVAGITECLPARVEHLSGGQRQRVGLVRALLTRPRLLLADEPTAGLDPVTGTRVLASLLSATSATLLLATHDLGVAARFPRIVGLQDGRIVYDGGPLSDDTVSQIYGSPV
ncbi:MAG: ATP-binding cassette domain-containing protein [Actinomycetota bacterium]|nr:ATP-binding cassette domain-containing protein [Actinomycetota bacterium]